MGIRPLKIGSLEARIPVIQGGMGVGISLSSLAGAVAKEGGIGILSTAQIGYRHPDFYKAPIETNLMVLEDEIKKARKIAPSGILGANIMVATKYYDRYVKKAVEAGIDLIISGAGLPIELPKLTEGSKVKIAPIVSTLKATEVISKYWKKKFNRTADLFVIEGPMAGGHLGFSYDELQRYTREDGLIDQKAYDIEIEKILTYVKHQETEENKEIPVIVAGGIYERKDMEHYLSMGASGVQMGTRFVTTYECDAPLDYKERYINAKKEDITLVKSPVGLPGRGIKNTFLEMSKKGKIPHGKCMQCVSTCNPAETPYCITQALVNAVTQQTEQALLFCGENAYRADRLEHVKDIMREFAP